MAFLTYLKSAVGVTALVAAAANAAPVDDAALRCGVPAAAYAHAPTAYACDSIAVIERRAVALPAVDWPAIKSDLLAAAASAATVDDMHGPLANALRRLDGHSRFLTPPRAAELRTPQKRVDRVQTEPSARIAYVDLRGFVGTDPVSMEAYVRTLREGIAEAERNYVCGYIVDLRRNPGGNMWPALLGLQPLLGRGRVGGFRTRDGGEAYWTLEDDSASAGGVVALAARVPLPAGGSAGTRPVAVLLGVETASAGEAVAIAFRDRPDTRSFGWRTAGLTTANAGYALTDNARIALAVAEMIDRNGLRYTPYVRPDEETIAALRVHRVGRTVDVTRNAAVSWLAEMPACGGTL